MNSRSFVLKGLLTQSLQMSIRVWNYLSLIFWVLNFLSGFSYSQYPIIPLLFIVWWKIKKPRLLELCFKKKQIGSEPMWIS